MPPLAITDLLNPLNDSEPRLRLPLPSSTPQKRSRSKELTRDQKVEVRTLKKYLDYTNGEIASRTGYTYRQVQQALYGPLTPKKQKPRHG
jgi:hypothetical protein